MSSIPDADVYNWIIGPVGRCVSYVADETRIAAILHRAIGVVAGQEPLLQFLRKSFVSGGMPVEGIDRLLAEQKTLGPWAKEILDAELHPINSHALIGLWSAVEVAVEDTICLILLKEAASLSAVLGAGTKMRSKPASPLSEDDARRVARAFERHVRSTRGVGASYAYMLSTLGVAVTLPDTVSSVLDELNYVRNCILHRGGVVDARVASEAPSLGIEVGGRIRVTSKKYTQYYDTVAEFLREFMAGVVNSRHIRTKAATE